MSSLFTNYFGVQNAKNFEQFVTRIYGNTYVTIGKSEAWSEGNPPDPVDSANNFYTYWDGVVALKKITAADMNLVIPRVDWDSTGQTIYFAYTEDLDLFKKTDSTQIQYDHTFYVRNSKDQVFKCLANCSTSNTTPVYSTIMPELNLGGQLPENAFIETGDGYKWKYMYTIPAGLKERFFTKEFMPVTGDFVVLDSAVNGRLDVFKVLDKGSGYNLNKSASSLAIATVSGNGTNVANITIQTTKTLDSTGALITDVNIINAGEGYTRATISINDPLKELDSDQAIIVPVIGPPGGHGSDVAAELGASNLMISVDIEGDESGILPIGLNSVLSFRQIGMLLDPRLSATNEFAQSTVYRATTKLYLIGSSGDFQPGQIVYCGSTLETSTFTAIVDYYSPSKGHLYVSQVYGSINTDTTPSLYGADFNGSGRISSVIVGVEEPEIKRYSGKLLYIEDTSEVTRTIEQITRFKFTLRF